ncbi:MAG: bifunctional phosphoribosyl-AMP cyclohydrolase/phosphoribosyl-ATP diphosphatase HisIE, partial [Psychroflexus sp.]|nr:bifunctional phosphoribosyl-AMP cyclohydrolase/phosphoribosyl-ATP diphosphatase HisIE [Psychroflexus sp.]
DVYTKNVLMLGYMNQEALDKTLSIQKVTFYSRSKQRLWTKGEESGNFLEYASHEIDCDQDTILMRAKPHGPICHKGTDTCWGSENNQEYGFLTELDKIILKRQNSEDDNSYVKSLFNGGINKIAQKVGEEAVELVIEAKDDNDELFLNESADLLFHYMILLRAKGFEFNDVVNLLKSRKRA